MLRSIVLFRVLCVPRNHVETVRRLCISEAENNDACERQGRWMSVVKSCEDVRCVCRWRAKSQYPMVKKVCTNGREDFGIPVAFRDLWVIDVKEEVLWVSLKASLKSEMPRRGATSC